MGQKTKSNQIQKAVCLQSQNSTCHTASGSQITSKINKKGDKDIKKHVRPEGMHTFCDNQIFSVREITKVSTKMFQINRIRELEFCKVTN